MIEFARHLFASDKSLFRSFEENNNSSLSGEAMFLVLWPELNGGAGRREGLSWADHYVRVQVSPSLKTKSESRMVLRPSPKQAALAINSSIRSAKWREIGCGRESVTLDVRSSKQLRSNQRVQNFCTSTFLLLLLLPWCISVSNPFLAVESTSSLC